MSKIRYPDNFKIEVVNHYRMHKNVRATLEKYGVSKSTLFKWKTQYESNHFTKIGKQKSDGLSPQARSHQAKVREVMNARRECGCSVAASEEEKMAAILKLRGKYSIHVLCEAVQMPRGTYYNRLKRMGERTSYELADEEIRPIIKQIFHESGERYGRYPICCKLKEMGYQVSKDRVSRLMKEMGLKVQQAEYTKEHLKSIPRLKHKNILKGEFNPDAPNKAWVSDITYIKVADRYMFICVILDLFSRRVISYGLSDTIDTVLVMNTFDEAYEERNKPAGLLFHSDQGVQYTSYAFREHLRYLEVAQSFSMPGYPYDNSVCESFFHTLKKESLYRQLYADADELSAVLDEYIEFYNNRRLHRALHMKTPSRFETEFYNDSKD